MTVLRNFLAAAIAGLALLSTPAADASEWEPESTLRLQIAFGVGGSTDTIGRVLVDRMREQTGWQIIAENVTGGGGVAMLTGIANRPAGNDVVGLAVNIPILLNLVMRGDDLQFDLDSFDHVGTISRAQAAVVARADAPFDDLAGMMEHVAENPGLAVGFGAPSQRFLMDAVAKDSGAEFNLVSTEGGAETIRFLLGGQVLVGFASGEHLPYLESGDLKVIGSVNPDGLTYAPEAQTFGDIGYGYEIVDPYIYLAMRADSDPAAVAAIAQAVDAALQTPEMIEIVDNVHQSKPLNLGPEGTEEMLKTGFEALREIMAK